MGVKALPLYQGGDWFTYRWSVAQAFDTLDHIGNLCHLRSWDDAEMGQADVCNILDAIVHLTQDVAGELAMAEADLIKKDQRPAAQRWAGFEMHQNLLMLRQMAQKTQAYEPALLFEAMDGLVSKIKDALKTMDQGGRG